MTYQKPDLFLVGSAQGLVLGANALLPLYSDNNPGGNHGREASRSTEDE